MQRSTNIAQKRILLIWGSYMGSSKKVRYGKWHGKASSNFSAFQLFHLCLISAISLLMQIIEMFLQGEFSSLMRQNSAKKWMGKRWKKDEKSWPGPTERHGTVQGAPRFVSSLITMLKSSVCYLVGASPQFANLTPKPLRAITCYN